MRDSLEKDTEGLLPKGSLRSSESSQTSWQDEPATSRWRSLRNYKPSMPIILLSITNITTLAFLFFTIPFLNAQTPSCSRLRINHPPKGVAPTLREAVRDPKPELFNVTFFPHDNPFRQRNSLASDIVWEEYTQSGSSGGYIMIPKGDEEVADIDPSRHAYVDRPDIGMVGYPVLPEAIHEMHCLDKLRQNLYYRKEHAKQNCEHNHCVPPELEEWDILHTEHCIEILRVRLACTADLGIVPFMWYRDSGKLTGDMVRMHTCSDYDAIKDLTSKISVKEPPLGSPEALKPPEGQFILQEYD